MLESILPRSLDSGYRGHPVARWVLIALTLITLGRSLVHMFKDDGGAGSIATIPLASFGPGGAEAVIGIFAFWGLSQLLLAAVYVVVLWRYPALIPFIYLLFIAEYLGRLLLGMANPIETTGTAPGGPVNIVFPALGAFMFYLALPRRKRSPAA
ncbi:MAG: hypothetical protein OSB70_00010 [Myxococcota bacterium]|nr:hypothetical protein [Myxococcota bacterium]